MGRPKGSTTAKRAGSKTRTLAKRKEDEIEDTEVVEEIVGASAGEKSRRGAAKTAKKPKRETAKRKAKEEIILDEEDEDDEISDEPKGKRSGRNAVELAFSNKSDDDSGAESAEGSKATKSVGRPKGKRSGSKSKTSIVKKTKRAEAEEGDEDEDEEDDGREYEVERIIDVKTVHKKREFLIKWKGFSIDTSTWEPEENLDHSKDLVQAFLNKVEKGDLSRTRRLSTIQSTKSSSSSSSGGVGTGTTTGLRRTQQGRVTKSRSRTPSRRSVSKSDKLSEEAPLRPAKREPNGDLALQKFMRESVERKLELLKNKERPRPDSTLGTVAEEGGGGDRVDARALRSNNVNNRRRFGIFARTALACSAAVASATALYLTSPDTLNWEHIAPHVRDAVKNIQERYTQLRAQAPF